MMCEVVAIDGGDNPIGRKSNDQDRARKTQKRKRVSFSPECLGLEAKEAQIESFRKQLDGLFGFYMEVMGQRVDLDVRLCGNNMNSVIGALIEESGLPLSKLVEE
ncbi:PREDICTED: chromatin assembly, partial [Prunus dulcis]